MCFFFNRTSEVLVLLICCSASPFCCDSSLCSCEFLLFLVPAELCVSFSQRAKPLLFDALRCGLYLILGKVCDPLSATAAQPFSGQRGSVCVAWLVVALWSRTEMRWAEPVIRVMDFPSRSELDDGDTAGNVNTSSSSVQWQDKSMVAKRMFLYCFKTPLKHSKDKINVIAQMCKN